LKPLNKPHRSAVLSIEGGVFRPRTCNLVARSFIGPRERVFYVVHKNGDPFDSRAADLEYAPSSHGKRLAVEQVREIRRLEAKLDATRDKLESQLIEEQTMEGE
jgi:hypothetical protein